MKRIFPFCVPRSLSGGWAWSFFFVRHLYLGDRDCFSFTRGFSGLFFPAELPIPFLLQRDPCRPETLSQRVFVHRRNLGLESHSPRCFRDFRTSFARAVCCVVGKVWLVDAVSQRTFFTEHLCDGGNPPAVRFSCWFSPSHNTLAPVLDWAASIACRVVLPIVGLSSPPPTPCLFSSVSSETQKTTKHHSLNRKTTLLSSFGVFPGRWWVAPYQTDYRDFLGPPARARA